MTRDATATASPGAVAAWGLTGRISPRRVVRAAAVDADGHPLNSYPLVHPVTGAPPWTPWAVHLADASGRYRLVCADLDMAQLVQCRTQLASLQHRML